MGLNAKTQMVTDVVKRAHEAEAEVTQLKKAAAVSARNAEESQQWKAGLMVTLAQSEDFLKRIDSIVASSDGDSVPALTSELLSKSSPTAMMQLTERSESTGSHPDVLLATLMPGYFTLVAQRTAEWKTRQQQTEAGSRHPKRAWAAPATVTKEQPKRVSPARTIVKTRANKISKSARPAVA